jgi:hypothetical protein
VCDGSNSVVLIATPLTYINDSDGDRKVWLNREIARIRFENEAKSPVKEIVLLWERVKTGSDWQPPAVIQIDPKKTVSHSSLFYPASFGCAKDVSLTACAQSNAYPWSDFADEVVFGRVKRAVISFEPDIKGPPTPPEHRGCEVTFSKDDIERLTIWRSQLAALQDQHRNKNLRGLNSEPYAYLSARCVEAPQAD